jgi:UDP-N-acetylglucosamine--N-acetylmuramyl-(pentapeptide) pyrophosphoryl-undecaprenol N-acetylglucosamine transferase
MGSDNPSRGFVFVGGGTGGHLYPAIAIIEQLKVIDAGVKTHIVCSQRRIDSAILESEDQVFSTIPASSPSGGVRGVLRFVKNWGASVRGVREVIRAMKQECDEVVVISMGGFVSASSAMAARAEKCELVLVNLDAVPGKANRWIGKRSARAFTAAKVRDGLSGFGDWMQTRPIVRGFDGRRDRHRAFDEFGLDTDKRTLLVTGGSQGARSVNRFMVEMARAHADAMEGWQVLHQVGGGGDGEEVALGYRGAGVSAVVVEYIEEMGAALEAADLMVGRCGAGTVGECWSAQVPGVFLPYPYHKDEHQKHNAAVLVEAGAALVCDDLIDAEKNVAAHGEVLGGLLRDHDRLDAMRHALEGLGAADGARVIADALMHS